MGGPARGIKGAHWPRGWLAQARHPRARPQKWESENKVETRVARFALRSFLPSPMLRAFAFVRRSLSGRTPHSTHYGKEEEREGGGVRERCSVCM